MLVTRSLPHLEISGFTLAPGTEEEVDVVLDWGDHAMTGRVLNYGGRPVAGAQLSLSWTHPSGSVHSRSLRRTLTDQAGSFRFTELGPGVHQLDVKAPGYSDRQVSYQVGRHGRPAELRLEPQ